MGCMAKAPCRPRAAMAIWYIMQAWVLQRPSTVRTDQKAMAAPPVLEFDADGNFVQGWGGPGEGYDWPENEHGIYVDPKGFVWIGGNGKTDKTLPCDCKFHPFAGFTAA
jgi:hypothetical protein